MAAKKLELGDWVNRESGCGGSYTGEFCPECGGAILHNGSYLCENWTWDVVKDGATEKPDYRTTCDWGLPSDFQATYIDRVLSLRLSGAWYTEGENRHGFYVNTHKEMPKKGSRYIKKKYREYLDNLGPMPERPWFEIVRERKAMKRAAEKRDERHWDLLGHGRDGFGQDIVIPDGPLQ